MISRRQFLAAAASSAAPLRDVKNSILVHEHIIVDFGGVTKPGAYSMDQVFALALPKLQEVKRLGCRRFLDATPAFLGRDVTLLRRLADASGIEIWTNTGIYGAADRAAVPRFARTLDARALASQFVSEHVKGVDGLTPRFIKAGVPGATLDELDRKLVQAAAIASRDTGLTIASHTLSGAAALQQLEILDQERVKPDKFVWVHAQNEKDRAIHAKVAGLGAWVEFDGLRAGASDWQRDCVLWMASQNLLHRTLISNDSGWYHVGEPGGGEFLPYTYLYSELLPRLDPSWHKLLLVENPIAAFGK